MSASMVPRETIDCLVRAAVTLRSRESFRWWEPSADKPDEHALRHIPIGGCPATETDLGQHLVDYNHLGVWERYRDKEWCGGREPWRYTAPEPDGPWSLTAGRAVHTEPPLENVLGCLRYIRSQSDTFAGIDEEVGADILRLIERRLLDRLADRHLGDIPCGLHPESYYQVSKEVR